MTRRLGTGFNNLDIDTELGPIAVGNLDPVGPSLPADPRAHQDV